MNYRLICLLAALLLQACAHTHDRRQPQVISSDERIEEQAADKLAQVGAIDRQARIHITAHNGVVLLSGEVINADLQQRALASVRTVSGVRLLHNGLVIGRLSSEKSQQTDEKINDQLATLLDKQIQSLPPFATEQLRVVTEQGVVFLMGLVSQEEGRRLTEIAQTVHGVKKVVQLFEYLDD